MEARLLSAILGVVMVQAQTAARDLDLQKVASLLCLGELGRGPEWPATQVPVTPTPSDAGAATSGGLRTSQAGPRRRAAKGLSPA